MHNAWAIRGKAGRLKAGSRPAAALGPWEARHIAEQRWQFTFESYQPDPYWFEHGTSFRAVMEMGRGDIAGPVEIVSRDPLILEMEIPRE